MRRYIVLLLITGILWAQTDFDILILKNGTTYFEEYQKENHEISNKGNKGIFLFCSIMAVVFIVLEVENMISQFTLGK